jgi:hypothetical protein
MADRFLHSLHGEFMDNKLSLDRNVRCVEILTPGNYVLSWTLDN